jgi:hypothetical protein
MQAQTPQTPMPKLPPAASKTQNQTVSTEERGARTINSALQSESRYPDLDSYLSRKITLVLDLRTQLTKNRGLILRVQHPSGSIMGTIPKS